MSQSSQKTVAVVGAGPVGLAAAAHLLEHGLKPIIFEAGPRVADSVRGWSHVRLFSPWQYNIDGASKRLLDHAGWNSPDPADYPTGAELVAEYLEPLATRTAVREHLHTSSRVIATSRVGYDKVKSASREMAPFELRYRNGNAIKSALADAIIDASGTWTLPNPAGSNGLPAIGEKGPSSRVAYGMPDVLGRDKERYRGQTVAVLGAGHSAVGSLIDLTALVKESPTTRVIWLLRGSDPEKSFGGGENDKLAARGELGAEFARIVREGRVEVHTNFHVSHLFETSRLRIAAGSACCGRHLLVDQLIVATGFRPDFSFLRELRLSLDPALECPPTLAPLIDPNVHSCGTVRPHGARELAQIEPGLYGAGMKSYGRAPTFLMATGYEQVRSIAAELAGDSEAAMRVELELPETGVCSVSQTNAAAPGCCGDVAPVHSEAGNCCTAGEKAKAEDCCASGTSDEQPVPV